MILIIRLIYSFFGILLLIGADLDIAIAEIIYLIFRDACKETYYQNGVLYLLQQKILNPANSAFQYCETGIMNATYVGCSYVSFFRNDPNCCNNLTSPMCDNTTLPIFGGRTVIDYNFGLNTGGSGNTYTVDVCETSCTGNYLQNGSTSISDTGYAVTQVRFIESQINILTALFGNHFTNDMYKWSCVETNWIPQLFSAGGLFIVGLYLTTIFHTIFFNRSEEENQESISGL